jgi:hypothetical protein
MSDEPRLEEAGSEPALRVAHQLLNRLIGLVTTIVLLGFLLVVGLIVAYLYFALNPYRLDGSSEAASQARSLLLSIWEGILPIAGTVLRVVAPVLLILGALVLLAYLSRQGSTRVDFSRLTGDLPSFLAIVIILTLCLLPLAGLSVPDVLNNIALVVVGFYFGKREATDSRPPGAA